MSFSTKGNGPATPAHQQGSPGTKKLTLDLNELRVESFECSPTGEDQRGIIKAMSDWNCPPGEYPTGGGSCIIQTCGYSCDTCDFSCGGTCGQGTCYGDSCVCWPPE